MKKKRKVNKETKAYKKKLAKKELKLQDTIWSQNIKYRDESKCVICGATRLVQAHHIIPREIKAFRHLFINGISLCPRHHRFQLEISAHHNPFAFFVWMMRNRTDQFNKLVLLNEEKQDETEKKMD